MNDQQIARAEELLPHHMDSADYLVRKAVWRRMKLATTAAGQQLIRLMCLIETDFLQDAYAPDDPDEDNFLAIVPDNVYKMATTHERYADYIEDSYCQRGYALTEAGRMYIGTLKCRYNDVVETDADGIPLWETEIPDKSLYPW